MAHALKPCPFCQCDMNIREVMGGYFIDGEHVAACLFQWISPVFSCIPEHLDLLIERWNARVPDPQALAARRNVGNALDIVGQIRQGANISNPELWNACEYLDNALAAMPRPA